MQGETKERWMRLAEQAATEQDPNRLMELVKEIDELLAKKQACSIVSGPTMKPGHKPSTHS
jgi:hypothetical protein